MEPVLLDTQILIWGVLRQARESQHDVQRRALWLLHELAEQDAQIVLPTVVLAELMIPMNADQRARFCEAAHQQFIVVPLDTRAADTAAALWQAHRTLPEEDRTRRQVLKSDVLILASGYAAGVRTVYSHDRKFRRLAELLPDVRAHDLPRHAPAFDFMLDEPQPPC